MTKDQKKEVIEALKGKFSQYTNFYVADTESLTVAQVSKLRRACFNKHVEMKVAKNTLIKKALESLDFGGSAQLGRNPSQDIVRFLVRVQMGEQPGPIPGVNTSWIPRTLLGNANSDSTLTPSAFTRAPRRERQRRST